MHIYFYDVSSSQKLAHLNGHILTFGDLYDQHARNRPHWPSLPLTKEKFAGMEFHPYGIDHDGGRLWSDFFSTACQILSGHSPSKDEMRIVRDYIRRLPNAFKKTHLDKRFTLSFVAYLFIGFKAHSQDGFNFDSNSIDSLVEFTQAVCSQNKLLFTSFLCAHRDPKSQPGEPLNLLQSRIPPEKIRCAASLVLALMQNASTSSKGKAVFLQQEASQTATSSVFPEVSVEYFLNARAYEMLERLQYQYQLVQGVLDDMSGERVVARLVSLDVLSGRIERFLRDRYGVEWRHLDFTSSTFDDPLVEVAVYMTLPDIERMMPFFSGNFQKDFLSKETEILETNQRSALQKSGPAMVPLVTEAIKWFMRQHSMTISAKAMYETTFYYLWGRYCGLVPGAFGVGFDRDHERFQHFAWQLGARSSSGHNRLSQTIPVYARRNPSTNGKGHLVNLSFRQFWRYES